MTSPDPGNVGYGTVRGRFVRAQIDSPDAGDEPDWIADTSIVVTFTPSPGWLLNVTASGGPAYITPDPIVCTVDSDGYLIDWAPPTKGATPPATVHQYVKLIATDDPDNNPNDWTWDVRIVGDSIDRRFSFKLPENSEKDLASLSPVASSGGTAIVVGPAGSPGDANLPAPYTANITGAYEIDPANGPVQALTVTGDVTITMAAPPDGYTTGVTVWLIQDATGGHVVTLPDSADVQPVRWAQAVTPTVTSTANSEDDLYLVGAPGLGWRGYVSGQAMS